MQTYGGLTITELKKLIAEEIETLRDQLERGPLDQAMHMRGQIFSFRKMDELIDEAAKRADQNNR